VRGAQGHRDAAVPGQVRHRGQGGRVGVLQVVENQQTAADSGADRFGEQGDVVHGQPGAYRPRQRQGGHGGEHGQATAAVDGAGDGFGEPAQHGAATRAGWPGDDDQARAQQDAGCPRGQIV
jgi:hypothetical protein